MDSSNSHNNPYQFDFFKNVIELDLQSPNRPRPECIGDVRQWLHRKGVKVELEDSGIVKIPPINEIDSTVSAAAAAAVGDNYDVTFTRVFNAFFDLTVNWNSALPAIGGPYWFEPFELRPLGILSLTTSCTGDNISYDSGQTVGLSEHAISHFSYLLKQTMPEDINNTSIAIESIKSVLLRIKAIVRKASRDSRLLMYLKYPWALCTSAGTVAKGRPGGL